MFPIASKEIFKMHAVWVLGMVMVSASASRLQYSDNTWILVGDQGGQHHHLPSWSNNFESQEKLTIDRLHSTNNRVKNMQHDTNYNFVKEELEHEADKMVKKDDKDFLQSGWHKYPEIIDRLERLERGFSEFKINMANEKHNKDNGEIKYINLADAEEKPIEAYSPDNVAHYEFDDETPVLIFRTQLTLLRRKNLLGAKGKRDDILERNNGMEIAVMEEDNQIAETVPVYPITRSLQTYLPKVDPETETIYITRGRLPSSEKSYNYYPVDAEYRRRRGHSLKRKRSQPQEPLAISKRIFSFWSRLQDMSHTGRELENRRHVNFYRGFPSLYNNGDIVSAETRAVLARPPGSPLRWG